MDRNEQLLDVVVPFTFVVMAELNKISSENDLSLTQLRVLGILWDHKLSMTELCSHLGLKKSTMSGLISRAESKELLVRMSDPEDNRLTNVILTKKGIEIVKLIRMRTQESIEPMSSRLSVEQRKQLFRLLERMIS